MNFTGNIFDKMNYEDLTNYQSLHPEVDLSMQILHRSKEIPIKIIALANLEGANDQIPSVVLIGWFPDPIFRITRNQYLSATDIQDNLNFQNIIQYNRVNISFRLDLEYEHYHAVPVNIWMGDELIKLGEGTAEYITQNVEIRVGLLTKPEVDNTLYNVIKISEIGKTSVYTSF